MPEEEKQPNMSGENEEDPFVDYEIKDFANTNHDHYYIEDPIQDPNSELLSVMCKDCPHGCNIEPDKFMIKKGKIVKTSKTDN